MKIYLAALDHGTAKLPVRERFSYTEHRLRELLQGIAAREEVTGAVLLCTCNRTELYLTTEGEPPDFSPARLLCEAAGEDPLSFLSYFSVLAGEAAVRHLMEVACGLRSLILCEDQIVTQVKNAARIAREEKTQNPVLETLFRMAVTAAKKAKTQVSVKAVPRSCADRAVELMGEKLGGLAGRRILVMGNGEMGRLCARRLVEAGCQVTVTLRTYRHGETVVPFGCRTIPYDRRQEALGSCDGVVSATASPHFTLTRQMVESLLQKPRLLVDLAVPRDIDPALEEDPDLCCLNIDHIATAGEQQRENAGAIAQIRAIMGEQEALFRRWLAVHLGADAMGRIKEQAVQRVRLSLEGQGLEGEALLAAAVEKAVDLVLFSARDALSYELIQRIEENLSPKGPE